MGYQSSFGDLDINGKVISKKFLDMFSKFCIFSVDDGISVKPNCVYFYLQELTDKCPDVNYDFSDDLLTIRNYLDDGELTYLVWGGIVPRNDYIRDSVMFYSLDGEGFNLRSCGGVELSKEFIDDLSKELVDYGVDGSLDYFVCRYSYSKDKPYDYELKLENVIEELRDKVSDHLAGELGVYPAWGGECDDDIHSLFNNEVQKRLYQLKDFVDMIKL